MSAPDSAPGNQIFAFRRNWPFVILVLILAIGPGIPFAIEGDWRAVAIIVAAVIALPLFLGVLTLLPELFGARIVLAVHAHGIIWGRLWQRGFIPWSNLERVRTISPLLWQFNERRGAGKPINLRPADATLAASFIAERLPKK